MPVTKSDPRLTATGAVCDEYGLLDFAPYKEFKHFFKDGKTAPGYEGLEAGEEIPYGVVKWQDANGAGFIARHPVSSRTRWFNCHTWESWRYAFVLACLQREVWEQKQCIPPSRSAVHKRPASAKGAAHASGNVKSQPVVRGRGRPRKAAPGTEALLGRRRGKNSKQLPHPEGSSPAPRSSRGRPPGRGLRASAAKVVQQPLAAEADVAQLGGVEGGEAKCSSVPSGTCNSRTALFDGAAQKVVRKRPAARLVENALADAGRVGHAACPEAVAPRRPRDELLGGNDRGLALFNLDATAGREALSSFMKNGYAVVPNVFSQNDCDMAVDKIWNFASGRCPAISAVDEGTWTTENWSALVKVKHLCQLYGAGWVLWEERVKFRQRLVDLGVYADRPHHVSWDGFNFGRPMQKLPGKSNWDHTDQVLLSGKSTGSTWVQCSVALNEMHPEVGPAFECWPGSHDDSTFAALQKTEGLCESSHGSFRQLTDAGRGWLLGRGFERKRVAVGQGDAILWDSRLVHQGGAPLTAAGSRCERPVGSSRSRPGRIAAYICLSPQEYTPASVSRKRRDAFEAGGVAVTLNHKPDAFEPFKKGRFNAHSPSLEYPKKMPLVAKQLHGVV